MINDHAALDLMKQRLAFAVLQLSSINEIRKKSISNLERWKQQGVWCSAYDEWLLLLKTGSDAEVINAMTAPGENENRLRQSAPYTGLLDHETVTQIKNQ